MIVGVPAPGRGVLPFGHARAIDDAGHGGDACRMRRYRRIGDRRDDADECSPGHGCRYALDEQLHDGETSDDDGHHVGRNDHGSEGIDDHGAGHHDEPGTEAVGGVLR